MSATPTVAAGIAALGWLLFCGVTIFALACWLGTAWHRRSHEIDAAIAEDTWRIERDRQLADLDRRIAEAKRKDRDALIEALGLDGGAR